MDQNSSENTEPEFKCKVVFLGDIGVGKVSISYDNVLNVSSKLGSFFKGCLFSRLIYDQFPETFNPTMVHQFSWKQLTVDGKNMNVQVWVSSLYYYQVLMEILDKKSLGQQQQRTLGFKYSIMFY